MLIHAGSCAHRLYVCLLSQAHPEVKTLMGHEWRTKYIVLALVAAHVYLGWVSQHLSWPAYLFATYFFGATMTQALFLGIHEISHNLAFKTPKYNRWLAIFANLPIVFPYAAVFRPYHLDHHKFQGIDGIDTDIPCRHECSLVRGTASKIAWACCQILAYALRPCIVAPFEFNRTVALNYAVQLSYDAFVLWAWGWQPLAFHLLCILVAGGLHPCAGHFISEHYVFPHLSGTQETYSYYGPLNWLTWNVGYHNEHHDFPFVPWSRLPALRRIAHEHYDNLAQCDSWIGVIYGYIVRPEVGPFARVKRTNEYMGKLE